MSLEFNLVWLILINKSRCIIIYFLVISTSTYSDSDKQNLFYL